MRNSTFRENIKRLFILIILLTIGKNGGKCYCIKIERGKIRIEA